MKSMFDEVLEFLNKQEELTISYKTDDGIKTVHVFAIRKWDRQETDTYTVSFYVSENVHSVSSILNTIVNINYLNEIYVLEAAWVEHGILNMDIVRMSND